MVNLAKTLYEFAVVTLSVWTVVPDTVHRVHKGNILYILQFPQVNTAIVVNIGTRVPEQTGQSTLANSANSYMSKQC